jgi:hypothetical protein
MLTECRHKDRLMYAITNMHQDMNSLEETLEDFRKYGAPLKVVENKTKEIQCCCQHQPEGQ